MKLVVLSILTFAFSSAPASVTNPLEATMVSDIGGVIRKDSEITLEPAEKKAYFKSTTTRTGQSFEEVNDTTLYNVRALKTSDSNAETAELQGLVAKNSLVLQKSDLRKNSPNCLTSNTCTVQNDVPAFFTGIFDMVSYFLHKLNPFNWIKSDNPAAPVKTADQNTDIEAADAMGRFINEGNRQASASVKSIIPSCDGKKSIGQLGRDKYTQCGIEQAQKAFADNRGRIRKEIIVFNDFSDGGHIGKMWFLNPDGSPAKVIEKNPLQVSRGKGGFGAGKDSNKTPNGAMLTRPYRVPRDGNIKDGIEVDGLEPGNKDIHSRGILLHGWDPYVPTEGCMGVSGTINSDTGGKRMEGSPPPYLDELKETVFKEGGVLVYNFTPDKKSLCR